MSRTFASVIAFSALALLANGIFVPHASAGPRSICVDNVKSRVVVKRKCKAPRFSEVTPSLLTEAQTLGGFEAGAYLKNVQVYTKSQKVQLFSGDITGFQVDCPEDTVVTGGGASITDNDGLQIRRSIPRTDLGGWAVGVNSLKFFGSGTVTVYAVCAESYIAAGY